MSKLSRTFAFQESSINGIKDLDDMKRVFADFVKEFNKWYAKYFDQVENGGFETNTWRGHEATTADLEGGKYKIGDLLIQRKIDGIWQTANAFRKV